MPDSIRFHLDENIHPEIAVGLRRHGVDVTTAGGVGLLGASDAWQLDYAREQRRVLVTHDQGFLALYAADHEHAGIAYCHPRNRSIGRMLRSLLFLWTNSTADEMHGCVAYL